MERLRPAGQCYRAAAAKALSVASRWRLSLDTGTQTVTVNTYIGATRDWNGSLDVFTQAYGATAGRYADFGNSFAVNLDPLISNTALNFSYPRQPMVTTSNSLPESPSVMLFGLGLLAALS
jgi:hypothetical protein